MPNDHEVEAAGRNLYHGTSSTNLPAIFAHGIRSPSWWGVNSAANYYAEVTAEEDGGEQVIITIPLAQFNADKLEPDGNSVDEPLTTVLNATDEALYERWEVCNGTWQDCLHIYGSVLYRGDVIRITSANVRRSPTTLSAEDQTVKQWIEDKYDVSGISLGRKRP